MEELLRRRLQLVQALRRNAMVDDLQEAPLPAGMANVVDEGDEVRRSEVDERNAVSFFSERGGPVYRLLDEGYVYLCH